MARSSDPTGDDFSGGPLGKVMIRSDFPPYPEIRVAVSLLRPSRRGLIRGAFSSVDAGRIDNAFKAIIRLV